MSKRSVLLIVISMFALLLGAFNLSIYPVRAEGETIAMPRISQVSAGSGHALALGEDGSLWSWGDNSSGQLGDGTFESRSTPVQVGSSEDWKAAAAGDQYSIGIKKDGSLWMWGTNKKQQYKQLKKAVINQNTPVRYGKDKNWVKVTAGPGGAAALRQDGTVYVFGLGVMPGVIEDQTKLSDDTDWIDVSVGSLCLLALKKDGSLWAKGLCTPNGNSEPIELQQLGEDHDWIQMSASFYSTALKKDGSVWMLKMGDTPSEVVLNPVEGLPKAVEVGGDFFAVVVCEDGTVMKWGTSGRFTPIDAGAAMKHIDESGDFGVALSRDGVPWTYGKNDYGQLGIGEVNESDDSATISGSSSKLVPVQAQVQYRAEEPAPKWSAAFQPFTLKDTKARVLTAPHKYVLIYKGTNLLTEGTSNEVGIFEFKVPVKIDGIYTAIVTDISEEVIAKASYSAGDTKPPAAPKVTAAIAKTKLVKGYAEPLSTVTVIRQGRTYQAKADGRGVFQVQVPLLAAGEQLKVWAADAAGNQSKEVKVKVAGTSKK